MKPNPQILKNLWSSDDLLVLKTLHKLRTASHLAYMPDLLNLLSHTKNELIEQEIIRFVADIKQKAVVPVIVDGLKRSELTQVHAGILSAIWQSGLDYSSHLDLFIQLFLKGNYLVALESFTIIEQSIDHLSEQEIEVIRKILLDGLDQVSEEKEPLTRELLKLLQL